MKRTILILFLHLAAGTSIFSQQLSIGFTGGVGTYSMNELKTLNDAWQPDFDAKLVSDFPAWFYYQPSLRFRSEKYTIGFTCTFQSTGSRISAKDYSGEYRFDMLVHSKNLGVYFGLDVLTRNKSRFSVYAEPGLTYSNLKINQYLHLLSTVVDDQTVKFRALNLFLEHGIAWSYSIFPSFTAGLNLGYSLQAGKQDFYTGGDTDRELVNPVTHESIRPQWNGFRFGITLMYHVQLKKGDNKKTE
jgi:hypothetical protein